MLFAQKDLKTSPTWRAVLLNNNVYRTYDNIKDVFIIRDNDKKYYYTEDEQKNKFTLDLNGREYIDFKILREADGIIFFKVLPCAKIDKTNSTIIVEGANDGG